MFKDCSLECVKYIYRFYIYQKVKDNSGYICKNILFTMKVIFIRKL